MFRTYLGCECTSTRKGRASGCCHAKRLSREELCGAFQARQAPAGVAFRRAIPHDAQGADQRSYVGKAHSGFWNSCSPNRPAVSRFRVELPV